MLLTVKQLKEALEPYKDDMKVLIFVGKNGKPRKITSNMQIIQPDGETVYGIALEVEI